MLVINRLMGDLWPAAAAVKFGWQMSLNCVTDWPVASPACWSDGPIRSRHLRASAVRAANKLGARTKA